jgi:excisionase family DNA binding protein
MIQPKRKEFLTSREAAQTLGVSLRTVQLWVENGVLHAWKTAGGHRRVVRASVERVLTQQRQAVQAEPRAAAFTLLVVEDDEFFLEAYRLKIREWDLPLRLVTAGNGFEGLVRIGHYLPDLIITDLAMPGMDGFQMVRSLVKQTGLKDMEVIVVTGLEDQEIQVQGGLPPEVKVIRKPAPFDHLESMVSETLVRVGSGMAAFHEA